MDYQLLKQLCSALNCGEITLLNSHGGTLTGPVATPDVSEVIDRYRRLRLQQMDGLLVYVVSLQVPIPFESN